MLSCDAIIWYGQEGCSVNRYEAVWLRNPQGLHWALRSQEWRGGGGGGPESPFHAALCPGLTTTKYIFLCNMRWQQSRPLCFSEPHSRCHPAPPAWRWSKDKVCFYPSLLFSSWRICHVLGNTTGGEITAMIHGASNWKEFWWSCQVPNVGSCLGGGPKNSHQDPWLVIDGVADER